MRYWTVVILSMICVMESCAQSSLQHAQGTWEEEVDDLRSYIVVEGNFWYSIVEIDGEIVVSKDWMAFFNDFDADSLHVRELTDEGQYLVFLNYRKSIKNYDLILPRKYFNFYSYDLNEDYFIYYGNNPVTLNRIDELPSDIEMVFQKKKVEMAHIRYIEDQ